VVLADTSTKPQTRQPEPPTRTRAVAVALLLALVIAWSVLIEWEWSFVDDPAQKLALTALIEQHGVVSGILHHIGSLAGADATGWGLFRPTYYVYSGLFYLASPAVAHGVRLAMLLIVVLVPVLRLTRRADGSRPPAYVAWALCLILANNTLYQNLTFLSLQELTGLTFVALGLATASPWARAVLWLAAAWVKTPFVWLFLAWGVCLILVRRTRRLGLLVLVVGAATVVAAALFARAGTYTATFVVSPEKMLDSATGAASLFYWPGLIGVLGLIAFRPRVSTIAWLDPLALVLAGGGALYLANLLPWGSIDVYYGSPFIWMVSAAAIRLGATAELRSWSGQWRRVTALLLAVAIALTSYLVAKLLWLGYERNQAVVQVRDFAIGLDGRPIIGISGAEASHRLHEIVLMHRPRWAGTIVYVDPSDTTVRPDYYVTLADQPTANPRLAKNPIRVWPAATIYDP